MLDWIMGLYIEGLGAALTRRIIDSVLLKRNKTNLVHSGNILDNSFSAVMFEINLTFFFALNLVEFLLYGPSLLLL